VQHSRSDSLFSRAQEIMPGGVNSPVRSFANVGGTPPFIARGQGPYIWDVDGNKYLDFLGSWGPLLLGHANEAVTRAIQSAVVSGTSFGAPTENEVELAEMINRAFPSMEMLRLVNSGTEATMSAIRVARAYTGRDKIIKFNGCYHGHADGLLVKAGSGAATIGVPTSPGVPNAYAAETLVAEYNQLETVEMLLTEYSKQVAAIIVEPVAGNMGVVPPSPGFLAGLRAMAHEHGSLLIFDEVITGFRIAYGGAQQKYGVEPDITCLGKIIGGGLPIGAYGGHRDIMSLVAPTGPVYQAGTLSGNPLAVSAGLACITELGHPGVYERLEEITANLEQGILAISKAAEIALTVNRVGSMFTIFHTGGPVAGWNQVARSDKDSYASLFHKLLNAGIYSAPSQFEAGFVSTAHTASHVDEFLEALRIGLRN
jgi:glutamate-1-semialdehyde 2,1-aminomutase